MFEHLKRSLSEHIAEALICKEIFVLVEGVDDIPIYEEILSRIKKDHYVESFSNLSDKGCGCDCIIEAITEYHKNTLDHSKYAYDWIAILDRDIRHIRGTIPNHKNIFVLKSYSIENYFINKTTIECILRTCTNCGTLSTKAAEEIYIDIISDTDDLLTITAEAILNGLYRDYCGYTKFSLKWGAVSKNKSTIHNLSEDKEFILKNAQDIGFPKSNQDILQTAKGKWALKWFSEKIAKRIEDALTLCGHNTIPICQSCTAGNHTECRFTPHEKLHAKQIYAIAKTCTNCSELSELTEQLRTTITPPPA